MLVFLPTSSITFIRRFLTVAIATSLINSFIITRIDFCNSILAGLPRYQSSRIHSILNVAARLIHGHSRCERITPTLRDRMHWLRVPERIVLNVVCWSTRHCMCLTLPMFSVTASKTHQDCACNHQFIGVSSFLHQPRQ